MNKWVKKMGKEKGLFLREATGLVREFGPITAVLFTMCFMIGSGINFRACAN